MLALTHSIQRHLLLLLLMLLILLHLRMRLKQCLFQRFSRWNLEDIHLNSEVYVKICILVHAGLVESCLFSTQNYLPSIRFIYNLFFDNEISL